MTTIFYVLYLDFALFMCKFGEKIRRFMKTFAKVIIFILIFVVLLMYCDRKHEQQTAAIHQEQLQKTIDSLQILTAQQNTIQLRIDTIYKTIQQIKIVYKDREQEILSKTVPENLDLLTFNVRNLADTLNIQLKDTLIYEVNQNLIINDSNILPVINVSFERTQLFQSISNKKDTIILEQNQIIDIATQKEAIYTHQVNEQIKILKENERLSKRLKRANKTAFISIVLNGILVTIFLLNK